MSKASENIAAVAALSKIAEIRQYRLAQDYSSLMEIPLAREINESAKNTTGVDLLNTSKKLTLEDLEKYEAFLDKVVNGSLKHRLPDTFLADEMALLSDTKPFPLHSFRSFDMRAEHISSIAKNILNSLGIITPSIIPLVKSATRVQSIDKEQDNFLALASTQLRGKQAFVLFHVKINTRTNRLLNKPTDLDKAFKEVTNKETNTHFRNVVFPSSCFLISPLNPLLNEESLVHLFLQGILHYGRDLTIGSHTRKFFREGVSSSLLLEKGSKIDIDDKLAGNIAGAMGVQKTPTGYFYDFAYVIGLDLLIRDYKKGQFNL
jgi:hypothetical protein